MITKTVPLKYLTTIRQKGSVQLCYIEDIGEIDGEVPLIGGGSNVIVKDSIKLYRLSGRFDYIKSEGGILRVGGSTPLKRLISYAFKHSLSCLEFLAGVPATVGGLTVMNAGAFGHEISEFIDFVKVYDLEKGTVVIRRDVNFAYRMTDIVGIVVEIGLKCNIVDGLKLRKTVSDYIKRRIDKAHLLNTFGSVFKNPSNEVAAGKLIEECGLKGRVRNSAMISRKHGNFIVGSGDVDVDDVLYLIELAEEEVLKRFGIELEREVRVL